jgi:hypothetical protein
LCLIGVKGIEKNSGMVLRMNAMILAESATEDNLHFLRKKHRQ